MKRMCKRPDGSEAGYALIAVLISLLVGSLMILPLLAHMSTGIKAAQLHEERMYDLYAAEAGVEDAIHKLVSNDAPLQGLEDDQSYEYAMDGTQEVNGQPVDITLTKRALIDGLVEDYNSGQPHEDWIEIDVPAVTNQTQDYIEYSVQVSGNYTGGGNRRVESAGVFFTPHPGSGVQIDGPDDVNLTGVLAQGILDSTESSAPLGGFAFNWEWAKNHEPRFDHHDREGTVSFTFRVYDPDWVATSFIVWLMVREQDVCYVASSELSKWRVESSAGDVTVASTVFNRPTGLDIVTWQVGPSPSAP
jgi:hypothetical protein